MIDTELTPEEQARRRAAKPKRRTVYAMRIRAVDSDPWSGVEYYARRKNRDRAGSIARIIAGFRTHSWEEKKTLEEIGQLEFADE